MSRILVVDDDKYMVEALAIMLTYELGYDVITAVNGYEAIAKLRKNDIDLIITDLKMPGIDGFALVNSVLQKGMRIPAIVITAFHTPEDEKKAEALRVFAYLTKPFDNDYLKELVHKALEHSDGKQAGKPPYSCVENNFLALC